MKDPRIVLIGAGSAQFGAATLGDIFSSRVLSGCTVVLHDIDTEALERTRRQAERACSERGLDFRIEATCDRGKALRGADFCILSIE
ncbi:MAG: alpha-glucosidase, partial [Deltaproteobacteria bacterium]